MASDSVRTDFMDDDAEAVCEAVERAIDAYYTTEFPHSRAVVHEAIDGWMRLLRPVIVGALRPSARVPRFTESGATDA